MPSVQKILYIHNRIVSILLCWRICSAYCTVSRGVRTQRSKTISQSFTPTSNMATHYAQESTTIRSDRSSSRRVMNWWMRGRTTCTQRMNISSLRQSDVCCARCVWSFLVSPTSNWLSHFDDKPADQAFPVAGVEQSLSSLNTSAPSLAIRRHDFKQARPQYTVNVGANALEKESGGKCFARDRGSQYSSSWTSLKLFSPDTRFFTQKFHQIRFSAAGFVPDPDGSS